MTDRRHSSALTRRGVLTACVAAGLGGCTSLESLPGTGPDGHPFADRTVRIQIQTVQQDFDRLARLVTEAATFWNNNQESLSYTTTLTYDADTDDPDVLVTEVPDIDSCGVHGGDDITGCAPVLKPGAHDRLPATLELTPQPPGDDWHYQRVIEHELGHLLGLDHEDEPVEVMHVDWEERYPQHDQREHIFTLRKERSDLYNQAFDRTSAGFDAAESDQFAGAADLFRQATDAYQDAVETIETSRTVAEQLDPFEPADRSRLDDLLTSEEQFIQTALDGLGLMVDGAESLAADDDGAEVYNDGVEVYRGVDDSDIPAGEAYLSAVGFPTGIITDS